jgi:ribosomal protein S21
MTKVKVRAQETLESALRRFTRATLKTVKQVKERSFYVKPSKKRFDKRKTFERKLKFENLNK